MPPIRLTDAQLTAVFEAARPLAVASRDAFLLDLAVALQGQENLGDGTVFRLIREVQRRHFDPGRGKGYPLSALQSAPQSPVSIVCPSLRRDNHSPSLSAVVR
jgi:hypothetical protein